MTDTAGNQWSWTYDVLGRLTASSDPDKGTTTSSYDPAGRLTSSTDARGAPWTTATTPSTARPTNTSTSISPANLQAHWSYDTAAITGAPAGTVAKGQPATADPLPDRHRRHRRSAPRSPATTAADRPTGTSITLPAGYAHSPAPTPPRMAYAITGQLTSQDRPTGRRPDQETISSAMTALASPAAWTPTSPPTSAA